jgi:hypothetical protein
MTKETTAPASTPQTQPQPEGGLALVSMILGVVSLTGPGLLLGIPAIITGIIALKKNQGSRGLSITGLVTGAVSTVVSILIITFMAFLVIWGINHPAEFDQPYYQTPGQSERLFESSQT